MTATAPRRPPVDEAAERDRPVGAGQRHGGLERWLPYGLWAALAVVYSTVSLTRYDRLDVVSWDLGIFAQAARSYAERGYPVVDIKGPGFELLGDHFSPVIALWGPLWAFAPSPVTLLVCQSLLVSFSVVPVTRAALRVYGGAAAGGAVGLAYGLSFGLLAAVDFDVHEYAFAAPLLALAGEAYLRGRWRATAGWSAALVLVKEDLGITVAAVGLVLFWSGARRWGAGLALFGAGAAVLTLLVVIPAVAPDGSWDYWERIGGGAAGSDAGGLVSSLWSVPAALVTPTAKVETWLLTFGITGFLALRSPWALVAVPTLAWRMASDYPFYWGTDLHYSLIPMPILFVAMLDAVVRTRTSRPWWLRRYAAQLPAVVLTAALVLCLDSPLARVLSPAAYADSARERDAERVLAMLPSDSSVETDIGLLAPLVAEHDVYFTGTNSGPDSVATEWVIVDTSISWDPAEDLVQWAERRHPGAGYQRLPDVGRYLIARRVS
jgi:Predicted membrane protein (DUF2079)